MLDPMESHRVLVWDRSTRLFHWSLATCVTLLLITGYIGLMKPHAWLGQLTVALLVFRLVYGWLGSQTAKFADFVSGPRSVVNYLRHKAPHHLGHNPLGGWMVVVQLLLLGVQATTGLIGTGDGLDAGPLAHWVSPSISTDAHEIHALQVPVLAVLALLHVGAVLVYRIVFGQDLIRPMIHGVKSVPRSMAPPRESTATRAAVSWGSAAIVFVLIITVGLQH